MPYQKAEEEFVCDRYRSAVQVHLTHPVIDVVVIVCYDLELSEVTPFVHIAELVRSAWNPLPI